MRWLLALILGAAVLWGGYWFIGARAVERGATAWFAQSGGTAQAGAISVAGFPNRFDLTVTAPEVFDPRTGLGWQAPFLQIFALIYRPHHLIAVWPETQTIQTPMETLQIASDRMRASVVLEPGRALQLDRAALAAEGLEINVTPALTDGFAPWSVAATEMRLAGRQVAGRPNQHDLGLEITGLAPAPGLIDAADLPGAMDQLLVEARVTLDRSVRLTDTTPPRPEVVEVRNLFARWGSAELHGNGTLTVEDDGTLTGRIDLRADDWRQILSIAVALRLIRPEVAPTWEAGLQMLAQQNEPESRITLPLVFNRGAVSLGPLPLGAGPRLARPRG